MSKFAQLLQLATFGHYLSILNWNSIFRNPSKVRHFKANRAATPGEELIKILFLKYKTFNNPHLFNTKPQILIHNRVHNAWRKKEIFSCIHVFKNKIFSNTIENTSLVLECFRSLYTWFWTFSVVQLIAVFICWPFWLPRCGSICPSDEKFSRSKKFMCTRI